MKREDFFKLLNNIDNDLLENERQKKKSKAVVKYVGAAASVLIILAGVILALSIFKEDDKINKGSAIKVITEDGGRKILVDNRDKLEMLNYISKGELAVEWRWELKEVYEKYTSLKFDNAQYGGRYKEIDVSYIDEKIGNTKATGYDIYEDKAYEIDCDVYAVKKLNPDDIIAVKFEGSDKCFVFDRDSYKPYETLGEFADNYNLEEYISLTELYYTAKEGNKEERYCISKENSDYVWELLRKNDNVKIIEDYTDYKASENISFLATSEPLGISDRSFSINEEGYIVTNIADYGYYYYIGEKTAGEIIDYVKSNMKKAENREQKYIVGTIVETGDDYFVVDDSVLLKNPELGIQYRVKINDNKIRRYFTQKVLIEGIQVLLEYEGNIYADEKKNNYSIENITAVYEVNISDKGDVYIPE